MKKTKKRTIRKTVHKPLKIPSLRKRSKFIERAIEADDGLISAGGVYARLAQSMTLNDFAEQPGFPEQFKESFKPGETEIWYRLNSKSRRDDAEDIPFLSPRKPKIGELKKSHVLIGKVAETHNESIFAALQDWTPTPPGSPGSMFLAARGAEHTSFSIGDCVVINGRGWMCSKDGWISLEP